jgi:hypothetical protein
MASPTACTVGTALNIVLNYIKYKNDEELIYIYIKSRRRHTHEDEGDVAWAIGSQIVVPFGGPEAHPQMVVLPIGVVLKNIARNLYNMQLK